MTDQAPSHSSKPRLVLGSTSPFRRELLDRLGVPFEAAAPEIDESPLSGESPEALVLRLARAKAEAVAMAYPDALIIGSDQVACIGERILGKPGDHAHAVRQLEEASGKRVAFFTGLCLFNVRKNRLRLVCEPFYVHFRTLSRVQIERYLDREQPYDCAGSFRSEGLGISLLERLEGKDPNALVGLPLIELVSMLNEEGFAIP